MNSQRRRIRVKGARKSWEMAASIWVRSPMKCWICACMVLKAIVAWRISSGPSMSMGGARRSPPKRLAALAKRCNGLANCRVATQATSKVAINPRMMITAIRVGALRPQLRSGGMKDNQLPSSNCTSAT
ncbi:hypothetical protein PFLmoz3_02768 [Pseudomonas fluorescens]|uniref:Uncharacterized protein n=1 Tax=Pseudomonas fluorescens TaxID=294 RepID=A0A109LGU8_PSEFL|nr:hypothetical protein PFLmoz3_02768 [Pseudomonas fluorescens]